jgi:FAD-linked sulfhydryl oxidase
MTATTSEKKPCRVCAEFSSWRHKQASDEKRQAAARAAAAAAAAATMASHNSDTTPQQSSSSTAYEDEQTGHLPCPPDAFELGNATWTFLHTTAAYYPDNPTPAQRFAMRQMLNGLAKLYPCGECAEHLQEEIRRNPPDVESRAGLGRWLCYVHNQVNERLGKPKFDCERIDERWRDGPSDGFCD